LALLPRRHISFHLHGSVLRGLHQLPLTVPVQDFTDLFIAEVGRLWSQLLACHLDILGGDRPHACHVGGGLLLTNGEALRVGELALGGLEGGCLLTWSIRVLD
jgi:hypothetical protein